MSEATDLEVSVRTLRPEAEHVMAVELVPYGACTLPPFTAGSHIDLHLPNGLTRSYSLMNPESETSRYLIGVFRDPKSRGGSKYVHDELRAGQLLRISAPRNNFRLAESADRHVFIAGGIGITPFCSMLDRLNHLGKSWVLHYCVRTRSKAGFLTRIEELASAGTGKVALNFDEEPGGQKLDIAATLAGEPPDTHAYCCGPDGMLAAFKHATQSWPSDRVHLEYFTSSVAAAVTGGFKVVLARSGKTLLVPPGNTILNVLLAEGIDVPYACQQGICGACETTVLAGVPEHRDMVLTPQEQAENKTMMICCSGSSSDELVLDR